MKKEIKTLTVKEAIKQGYTKYGISGEDWQIAEDLHDDVFDEVEDVDGIVLFEKHYSNPSVTNSQISDILSDIIGTNDSEETGRDDDQVYDAIKNIDYTEIVNTINKELEKHKYWMLTDIQLIRDEDSQ